MKHDWLRVSGVGTTWWLIVLFSLLGLHLKIRLHFTHQFGFLVGLRPFYLLPGKIGNSGNSEPVFPGPSRDLGSSRWSHGLIARKLFLPLRLCGLFPLCTDHTAITREGLWGCPGVGREASLLGGKDVDRFLSIDSTLASFQGSPVHLRGI